MPSSPQHPVSGFQAAYALPGASCAGFFCSKAFALEFFKQRSVSNPQYSGNSNFILVDKSVQSYITVSERGGFEPPVPSRAHTTSNRAPSTTRTSLQRPTFPGYGNFILVGEFIQYYGERGIRGSGR